MKRRGQRKQPIPRKKHRSKPAASTQDKRTRVAHVMTKMRTDGSSLQHASKEFGIDARTVVRLAGSSLRKLRNGRYAAKASDRLLRVVEVLSPEGPRKIAVTGSRQATLVAEHWNAAHRYLETGDDSALQKFLHGQRITDASGAKVPLLTDLEELDRLGSAGVLSFESLYARSG
jgi:hypothetical protein